MGLVLVILSFTACRKNDPGDGSDKTATGRYGGVMVGSSGYFIVELSAGSKGTATVYFDGAVYHLATFVQIEESSSYNDLLFSAAGEDIVMYFTVAEDGSNPTVEFEIPGHIITATVDQYGTNDSSLSLYQGSSYSSSGSYYIMYTFNIALNNSDNTFKAISAVRATNTVTPIGQTEITNGTFSLSGNNITLNYNGQMLQGTIVGTTIQFDQPDFTMTGSKAATEKPITTSASIVGKWIPYLFFNSDAEGSQIEYVNANECPGGKYVEFYENGTYDEVWWEIRDGKCAGGSNGTGNYSINGNKLTAFEGEVPFTILELSEDKLILEVYHEEDGEHYYFKAEYRRGR